MPMIPPITFTFGNYEPTKMLTTHEIKSNCPAPTEDDFIPNLAENAIMKIANERDKQILLGYTSQHDSEYNCLGQLIQAGYALLDESLITRLTLIPKNWDSVLWEKYCIKSKEERLILAAAFIVAEIERNSFVKQQK